METKRVHLRALESADLERVHRWHNDPELYEHLGGVRRFVSLVAEQQWLQKKAAFSETELNLAICLEPSAEHIGNIYLRDIDWIARRAELHIMIGERQQRGRGHGQAAVRLLVEYAFESLGLQKVYLFVLADNLPAIHTYEKCGFLIEGTLRRHAFKSSNLKDVLLMAIHTPAIEQGT